MKTQATAFDSDLVKEGLRGILDLTRALLPSNDDQVRCTRAVTALLTLMYGDTCQPQDLIPVINHLHTILDEEAGK